MNETAALPAFFEPLIAEQYPADDVARIVAGCRCERPVTLRANTLRASRDEVIDALDETSIKWEPVAWYDDAFIIREAREKTLWELPIYREGGVYLQSLSAMIPVLALDPRPGEDICDLCAAPGGKTSQIAALTNAKAFITACELHAPRAEKLEFNLRKLDARNVTVMRTDARRLDDFFAFDRILLDAPCSGSGTIQAGDPKIHRRFTETLIRKSTKAQRALLDKALSLLKPGGTLVYATCSVLGNENEDIVEAGVRAARSKGVFEVKPIELAHIECLPLLPTRVEGALCICPTELYEGFFMARIERTR